MAYNALANTLLKRRETQKFSQNLFIHQKKPDLHMKMACMQVTG